MATGLLNIVIHLFVLRFNDTSTLMGHLVSSPRKREKREEIVEEIKEKDREETEEIKHSPSTLTCYKDSRTCPTVSQNAQL